MSRRKHGLSNAINSGQAPSISALFVGQIASSGGRVEVTITTTTTILKYNVCDQKWI